MAKNKWTEYIIETVQDNGKSYKRRTYWAEGGLTTLPRKAIRMSLKQAAQETTVVSAISLRIIPVNCELGESDG